MQASFVGIDDREQDVAVLQSLEVFRTFASADLPSYIRGQRHGRITAVDLDDSAFAIPYGFP